MLTDILLSIHDDILLMVYYYVYSIDGVQVVFEEGASPISVENEARVVTKLGQHI